LFPLIFFPTGFPVWVALLLTPAVGRVLLSFLPAGEPGGHSLRDLPATWAASHGLGTLILAAQSEWCALVGWDPGPWWQLAPWLLLGAGRVALLPARVRPRHSPPEGPRTARAHAGTLLALTAVAWLASSAGLEVAAHHAALCLLVADGARTLRRSPAGRAGLVALLAWSPILLGEVQQLVETGPAGMLLAAAAAGAVRWHRRGDRRGMALAALGLAGVALVSPAHALGAWLGACVLVLVSATPSRAWAAAVQVLAALLIAAPAARLAEFGLPAPTWSLEVALWLPCGLVGLARAAGRRPAREVVGLAFMGLAVGVGGDPALAIPCAALLIAAGCLPGDLQG
jgi:hypothetical protein